jgi:hypothetical protein
VSPYVQETLARTAQPFGFLISVMQVALDPLPGGLFRSPVAASLLLGCGLLLCAFGAGRLVRRYGRRLVVPGTFVLAYTMIHMIFPAHRPRYVLPILWLVYLAMASALEWVGLRFPARRQLTMVASIAAIPLLIHAAARMAAQPLVLAAAWLLLSAAIGIAWFAGRQPPSAPGGFRLQASRPRHQPFPAACSLQPAAEPAWVRAFPGMLLRSAWPMVASVVLAFGLRSTTLFMSQPWIRYNCAQFRALGEWYRGTAAPGDRMAVTLPWVVQYYSGLPAEAFVPAGQLTADTSEAALDELRRLGVTYVVWDSDYGSGPDSYHSRAYRGDLLAALRRRPDGLTLVHTIALQSKVAEVYRVL